MYGYSVLDRPTNESAERHYMEVNMAEAREYLSYARSIISGAVKTPRYITINAEPFMRADRDSGMWIEQKEGENVFRIRIGCSISTERVFKSAKDAEEYIRSTGYVPRSELIAMRKSGRAEKH